MTSREQLIKARRLSDREADEVIRRATVLQEKARAASPGRSVADVKEIGAELDIEDSYVDAALQQIDQDKHDEGERAAQRKSTLKKVGAAAFSALVLVLLLGGAGSGSVRSAAADTRMAQIALDTVIDRQAALVPQLMALAGGDGQELSELAGAVKSAPDMATRIAAADKLQLALATKIGQLPPADEAGAQQRLSLQHELVGAQNRITVERRRYQESVEKWRSEANTPFGKLGVALGFANAPR